ncbi:MAG TPA: MFS transporter [Solirubrobacteraceae bacterium]|jgi:MFS family permease|nr:MFS transporter [Solirubrobacteraceae bacterium]
MSAYLRVLRHQDFRYLFMGQAASVIGDRAVVVAIALYVTQSTGSATDLGLVLGGQTLPFVALLLFGGVWADRLPRHRIMIAADLTRAALHALLATLILIGSVKIWQLVAIEACFGAAQAFFQPAYSGLLPQTVPEPLIQDARALTESMANLAFLLGPALATVLVLGVGAGETFAFDAATFVLSAAALARVRPRPRGESQPPAPVLTELREGWAEVRSRPWVWATIAAFTGSVLSVFAFWYSLAPGLSRGLYGSVGVFGVLEILAGAGAVAGSLVSVRWRPAHPLRTGIALIFSWPLLNAAFALHAPLAIVIAFALANGFGFSLFMVWWETALAQHIPAHALSRVSAYDWMGSLALLPLGYFVAGPLAEALGARTVLGAGSAFGLLLLVLALLPRSTRELRREPAQRVRLGLQADG